MSEERWRIMNAEDEWNGECVDGPVTEGWVDVAPLAELHQANRRAAAFEHRVAELLEENKRLREAVQPLVDLLNQADELRHESGSTALWRLAYDDLHRARVLSEDRLPENE